MQTVEGITEYRLANGLKVLLAPDVADEKVTVNLTYLVGARHEGYGETGMAHLLEHLIFKGTPTTPDPKLEFRKRGFTFNGTTTADRTNYFATFVSQQESLDWYLGWQADAMVNSFIAKKDLDSEMSVVRSELEIGESNPFQALRQRMARAAYLWHAYGKDTIGAKSDIEHVDISHLQAFYKRYYRPDGAVLIVAGKFDVDKTLASIQKTLGAIPRPATPIPATYTLDSPQDGERSVVVRRPATTQLLILNYHVPAALHPDTPALNVLATALSDQPSGRLHKALVESKLAQAAFAGANAQREAGNLYLGVAFAPQDDPKKREELLLGIAEGLAAQPITQEEFDRAKTKITKSLELGFANAAAVANGALASEVQGDWRAVFVSRDRLKAVTLDEVNRVARTYLFAENRTLGHLVPTETVRRAPAMVPPDPAVYLQGFVLNEKGLESVAFDFSPASLHDKVVFAQMPAGVQTALLAKPVRGDLVTLKVALKFGNLRALQGQDAAAALAGHMLDKGTSTMSRQQIADALVQLGAALSMQFSESGGTVSLTAKKDKFQAALELMAHVLQNAAFPAAEFEELRSSWIKALEGQIKDKTAQAHNAWSRYGNPYPKQDPRYEATLEESLAQIRALRLEEVRSFYQRFYGAQHAQISVLGPIDRQEVQNLLHKAFGNWTAPENWKRIERPLLARKPARLVFDTPDKANVSISAYHSVALGGKRLDAEDYAMALAARIFGGGPGSRLWVRLREGGGLSYSAGANYSASAYEPNATISLSAEVAPQNLGVAEKAIREELERSLREGFTAPELESFRQQILADRQRGRSGDAWALGFMGGQMEFQHPKDYSAQGDALYASLSLAQVNAAWRKYVQPEKLVWGIFGDQSKIK